MGSPKNPDASPEASLGRVAPTVGEPASGTLAADTSHQLQFLYKSLDDNQSLIRFVEAKAAFAVALLSAMAGKILADLGSYFPWADQPLARQSLVLAFGFFALVAGLLVALIVFPVVNPTQSTRLLPHAGPKFFIFELSPKRWRRFLSRSPNYSMLAEEHENYLREVANADSRLLLRVISAEVLKVSYIRQIKTERLRALGVVLACCAALFAGLMVADASAPRPKKPELIELYGPGTLKSPVGGVGLTESQPTHISSPHNPKPDKIRRSTKRP
jgi:hypothetical protein